MAAPNHNSQLFLSQLVYLEFLDRPAGLDKVVQTATVPVNRDSATKSRTTTHSAKSTAGAFDSAQLLPYHAPLLGECRDENGRMPNRLVHSGGILEDCQDACTKDPKCVAYDWNRITNQCSHYKPSFKANRDVVPSGWSAGLSEENDIVFPTASTGTGPSACKIKTSVHFPQSSNHKASLDLPLDGVLSTTKGNTQNSTGTVDRANTPETIAKVTGL